MSENFKVTKKQFNKWVNTVDRIYTWDYRHVSVPSNGNFVVFHEEEKGEKIILHRMPFIRHVAQVYVTIERGSVRKEYAINSFADFREALSVIRLLEGGEQ